MSAELVLAGRTRVRVTVVDVLGRTVATLLDAERPGGPVEVAWDGSTTGGAPAGSGVYFLVARTPDGHVARKVTLLRD